MKGSDDDPALGCRRVLYMYSSGAVGRKGTDCGEEISLG